MRDKKYIDYTKLIERFLLLLILSVDNVFWVNACVTAVAIESVLKGSQVLRAYKTFPLSFDFAYIKICSENTGTII